MHVLWGLLLLIDLYEPQLQFLQWLDHFLRSQSQSEIGWRKCWKADHLMALGWKAPPNRQVVMLFAQLIQARINWTMVGHFFTSYCNLTHSQRSPHFHLWSLSKEFRKGLIVFRYLPLFKFLRMLSFQHFEIL